MDVVLDTNIILGSPNLESIQYAPIMDYLQITDSRIVLPRIVLDELRANYERLLQATLSKTNSQIQNFNKLFKDSPIVCPCPNVKESADYFIASLVTKFSIGPNELPDYEVGILREAIRRAIYHEKPCADGREEVRDTVLWLSVLQIASVSSEKTICFISSNRKDFGSKEKNELHPDLESEMLRRDVKVHFFNSMEEFTKTHLPKIQKFSHSFFESTLDFGQLNDQVREYLDENKRILRRRIESKEFTANEYIRVLSVQRGVDNYTIYEMKERETYYVYLVMTDEIEIEADVEIVSPDYYMFEGPSWSYFTKQFYFQIKASFRCIIEGIEVARIELDDVEFE